MRDAGRLIHQTPFESARRIRSAFRTDQVPLVPATLSVTIRFRPDNLPHRSSYRCGKLPQAFHRAPFI
jgi:hypothetical protein